MRSLFRIVVCAALDFIVMLVVYGLLR